MKKTRGEKYTTKTTCEGNKQRKYNCYVITHGLICSDNVLLYCKPSSFVKIGRGMAALRAHLGAEQRGKCLPTPVEGWSYMITSCSTSSYDLSATY